MFAQHNSWPKRTEWSEDLIHTNTHPPTHPNNHVPSRDLLKFIYSCMYKHINSYNLINCYHLMRQHPCAPGAGSRLIGQVVSGCPVPPSGGASDGRHLVVCRSVVGAPSLGMWRIESTTKQPREIRLSTERENRTSVNIFEGRKEGRKELVYLTSIIIIQNIHR